MNALFVFFLALVVVVGLVFLGLWIVQVAFGYFGFEFTMWQVLVIWLAAVILIPWSSRATYE